MKLLSALVVLVGLTCGCKKDPSLLVGPELWNAACDHLMETKIKGLPFLESKVACFSLFRDSLSERLADRAASCFVKAETESEVMACAVKCASDLPW
jgi:hypothetical protein